VALNKQAVHLLTLGVKKFLNDSHIGKKKAENYYNALMTDKENFNVCSSCPLNDKFGTEFTGCNSFLEYLTEIGGAQMNFIGMSCILEREYITEALRQIFQKKRIAKI
jgi:hypothetical protein